MHRRRPRHRAVAFPHGAGWDGNARPQRAPPQKPSHLYPLVAFCHLILAHETTCSLSPFLIAHQHLFQLQGGWVWGGPCLWEQCLQRSTMRGPLAALQDFMLCFPFSPSSPRTDSFLSMLQAYKYLFFTAKALLFGTLGGRELGGLGGESTAGNGHHDRLTRYVKHFLERGHTIL